MKYAIYSLLFIVFGLSLISCGKENIPNDEKKDDIWDKGDQKNDETDKVYKDWDCFQLIFPVSVEMPNGTIITGDNQESLNDAIKSWQETHPDFNAKYAFVYPLQITYVDKDELFTINTLEELLAAKKKCEKDSWTDKPCFKLIYPVSVEMPDGSIITEDSKESLNDAIKIWYENHPDSNNKFELQYPVEINYIGKDFILTITSEEEMIDAKKDCE